MTVKSPRAALAALILMCSGVSRGAQAPPPSLDATSSTTSVEEVLPPAVHDYTAKTGVAPSCLAVADTGGLESMICSAPGLMDLEAEKMLRILYSGKSTFGSYTNGVTVIAAGREAAAIKALELERSLQARKK